MGLKVKSQGELVRELLRNSNKTVSIIAPFIKVVALKHLIEAVPKEVFIRCVTRWLPEEIAAGVSDPEIISVLEERGNFSISLVDKLHAKLYIADDRCLTGSANVTQYGLGEADGENNIEILVETTLDDSNVVNTLHAISLVERPADQLEAEKARRLADSFKTTSIKPDTLWFPKSRKSERAYELYNSSPIGYVGTADQVLLDDIAGAGLQSGLNEKEFRLEIQKLLSKIPLAKSLLSGDKDMILTRADALPYINLALSSDFTKNDLWQSFVSWMSYFFSEILITQDISEVALRRAQILR